MYEEKKIEIQSRKFSSRKNGKGNFLLRENLANDGLSFSQLHKHIQKFQLHLGVFIYVYKKKHLVLIAHKR
jgi:hypothetical protein